MIEITGVSKRYGTSVVVDDVDLRIPAGGITAIIGANGAGKSTLLSMIARLVETDSGSILVASEDVHRTPTAELARRISVLRQENHLAVRLTVRDLVAFGRFPYSRGRTTAEDERRIDEAIAYLDLESFERRYLDELSGGQRQRAFVAMVLCQDTDYILLDEPLNSLDLRHSVDMMRVLRRAADELGRTVVVVMHDINFASAYADRIVAMKNGLVVHHGEVDEVVAPGPLRDVFDLDVAVHLLDGRRVAVFVA